MQIEEQQSEIVRIAERVKNIASQMKKMQERPDMPEAWRPEVALWTLNSLLEKLTDERMSFDDKINGVANGLRSIFKGFADASQEFVDAQDSLASREMSALYKDVTRIAAR